MEQNKVEIEEILQTALESDLVELDWEPVEDTFLARTAATCQTS